MAGPNERQHSQAKHSGGLSEDERARRKKKYYREKRSDLDPQSLFSKALETVGLDEPYRNDEGSYDYRRQAWQESLNEGNPDISWMMPEFSDEQNRQIGGALERVLGMFNPTLLAGGSSMQRPSQDERILAQLTEEERTLVAGADPDQADVALLQAFPDWQPKLNPFPTSMMGTVQREGREDVGFLPHLFDQLNYSPYSTEDILSFLSPSSPETVRRDIDAYKGGSSYLDRAIGDAMGVPTEEPPTQNPAVDLTEIGVLGAVLSPLVRTGRAAIKGGKRAVGAGQKIVKTLKGKPKQPVYPQPSDTRPPTWPSRKPQRNPLVERQTQAAGGTRFMAPIARYPGGPATTGKGMLTAAGIVGVPAAALAAREGTKKRKKRHYDED